MRPTTDIPDLQPIYWDTPDNCSRPRWLVPTIKLIKYSFVLHHQHGRPASQELFNFASILNFFFQKTAKGSIPRGHEYLMSLRSYSYPRSCVCSRALGLSTLVISSSSRLRLGRELTNRVENPTANTAPRIGNSTSSYLASRD